MTIKLNRRVHVAVSCMVAASLGILTGCSKETPSEPVASESAQPESTGADNTEATTKPDKSATSGKESSKEEEEKSEPSSTPKQELGEGVSEAKEIFGSLAPDSLWEQFERCAATHLDGSYECSSQEAGQFQFFESRSKAASTTQVLTELRSSTVVEDTGRFIVGWSTLGTTAVITVVDNKKGLVLQQLVSSDIVDPDDQIEKLGLHAVTQVPEKRDAESAEATTTDATPAPE